MKRRVHTRITSLFLVIIFFYSVSHCSEKEMVRNYFQGKLGETQSVSIDLTLSDSKITGILHHAYFSRPLEISGSIDRRGEVIIEVLTANKTKLGTIQGRFGNYNNSFFGTWFNLEKNKFLLLKTERVAKYTILSTTDKFMEVVTSFPFFSEVSSFEKSLNSMLEQTMTLNHYDFVLEGEDYGFEDFEFGKWTQYYDISIKYFSRQLISLLGEVYSYTGGAHGNTGYKSLTFYYRQKDFVPVTLSDLFLEDTNYTKQLSSYCIDELKKQEAGWVINGDLKSLDETDLVTFTINEHAITFYFAPYHVGCYAEGTHIVHVPYSAIREIIDPAGPLKIFR